MRRKSIRIVISNERFQVPYLGEFVLLTRGKLEIFSDMETPDGCINRTRFIQVVAGM